MHESLRRTACDTGTICARSFVWSKHHLGSIQNVHLKSKNWVLYFNDKSFSPQQFHIVNDHFGPVPRVKTLSLDLGSEFVNDPEQMVKLFTNNNFVKSADEPFLNLGNYHHNLKVFSYVDLPLTSEIVFLFFLSYFLINWETEGDPESSKAPGSLFSMPELLRDTDLF